MIRSARLCKFILHFDEQPIVLSGPRPTKADHGEFAAQLAASQSQRLLDAPFVVSQGFSVMGYAIALGGALLDNARLFEQVRHLAVSGGDNPLLHRFVVDAFFLGPFGKRQIERQKPEAFAVAVSRAAPSR